MKTKRAALLSCAFFCALVSFAQTDAAKMATAKTLIAKEQYYSALQVLNETREFTPERVHVIADLLMNHTITYEETLQQFTLEDQDVWGKKQAYKFEYPLQGLIWSAIDSYPDEGSLRNDMTSLCVKWLALRNGYGTTRKLQKWTTR